MGNAFQEVMKNRFDRNFGGTTVGVADPYISGYHFVNFVKLPEQLNKYIKFGDGKRASEEGLNGLSDIQTFLAGAALSVTPPGGTLEKTEFTGLGGIKYAVPTNVTYTNSITIKFLEFSSLPVLAIISGWVRMIRDYRSGVSLLDGAATTNTEYSKQNYAGTVLYWTTKPDGKTVEFSAAYTGLFPLKDPQDLYTGDLTSVDKLEVDIEFNVDYAWHEDWVHDKAQQLANTYHNNGKPATFRSQTTMGKEIL